jgi:hypothetical protein
LVSPHTLIGIPLQSLTSVSLGFKHHPPPFWISLGLRQYRGVLFPLFGLGLVLSSVSETAHWQSPEPGDPQPPDPGGHTSHLNAVTTASREPCTVLRIFKPHRDAPRFHISFQPAPTMGATSSLPSDSPLRCLLNNLRHLGFDPRHKTKNLVRFCTQIWPTYPLDNQNHWPLFGSLDPKLLQNT